MSQATFSERAEAALRGRGGRITTSRRALLRLLEQRPRPVGARELHRELRRRGVAIDRVSVYRNLSALLELGLLHRVLGTSDVRPCEQSRPEPKGHPEARCHHAIVCSKCGAASEFHSKGLERALGEVRRLTGFRVQSHLIELRGLCARCQPGQG